MNIVWFSWKDRGHPEAGGAERVSGEIMDRLAADGHTVKLITARYKGSSEHATTNGVEIVRRGGRLGVYVAAFQYYRHNLAGWADVVVDEMNTIPFMAGFYAKTNKRILLAHQLAREVWFYQMFPPISWVGYMLEPLMLRIIAPTYTDKVVVSGSTKADLERYGFKNVKTFKVGMATKPVAKLSPEQLSGALLSHGAIRPMKQTLQIVQAFEYARDHKPELHLDITGSTEGAYAESVMRYCGRSRHKAAINIHGRVSDEARDTLMKNADAIVVASVKEGWGLIVTEAASQGTPAVAYNGDGYRDSIIDGSTGILSKQRTPESLGEAILALYGSTIDYGVMREAAWKMSKQYSFDESYRSFLVAAQL